MKRSQSRSHGYNAHGTGTPIQIGIHLSIPLAAMLISTSCIYDAPGDKFYRTLWYSEEIPLGPFDVTSLTMEFLCNECISIQTTNEHNSSGESLTATDSKSAPELTTIYGRYEPDGGTAVLVDLQIRLQNVNITFIEAHRSGDTLFLLWRIEDSLYPFTTALHRLSAYPDTQ